MHLVLVLEGVAVELVDECLPKFMYMYSLLNDQLGAKASSKPVPTVQPQRVFLVSLKSDASITLPLRSAAELVMLATTAPPFT